jgi:hypothetical protein
MGQLFSDVEVEKPVVEDEFRYRRMSPYAIASLIGGIVALVGLATVQDIGPILYATIPAFGIVTGLRGLAAVKRYDETGRRSAQIGLALSVLCLASAWPLKGYLDASEVPPGYKKIGYDILQAKEGNGPVPDTAKELDGQRVFIKGFVYPGRETTGVKKFVLCRDNGDCCFGGQPKLNDMIQVTLKEPLSLNYDTTMRNLAGTFRVKSESNSGGLGQILYQLEADYLK